MLLRQRTLDGIAGGAISLAFRRWRRPTVRSGGSLLTASGRLRIGTVTVIQDDEVSTDDARRAGYESREALFTDLPPSGDGQLYRIEFGRIETDPRIALRESSLDSDAARELHARLARLDRASPTGPWTLKTLRAIRDHPGLRAGDLCACVDQDRDRFKPNVRKLKTLGLTESLDVGYRLSPRGAAYLSHVAKPESGTASDAKRKR